MACCEREKSFTCDKKTACPGRTLSKSSGEWANSAQLIPCISKVAHACSVRVVADCELGWPIYTLYKNQHSHYSLPWHHQVWYHGTFCVPKATFDFWRTIMKGFLKPGHWIWNHVNQKEIKYISDSNIRAAVDTPYTIYSVGAPALPSQTFYQPRSSSLAKFSNTHISS